MRPYIENNQVAEYFRTQPWQSYFPSLVNSPDIVNRIIETNPKGVVLNPNTFVLVLDENKPYSGSNLIYTFSVNYGDDPCPGYPGAN